MAVRPLAARAHRSSGDPSGADDRDVFRYRPGADERIAVFAQADDRASRALDADERRSGRLEPLAADHHYRAIRPDLFQPLPGPVGALLHGAELSDAVREGGGAECGGAEAGAVGGVRQADAARPPPRFG